MSAAQQVEAEPGHHGGQPGRDVLQVARIGAGISQPRLLDDILSVGFRIENAERHREQVRPLGLEHRGVISHIRTMPRGRHER